MALILNCVRRNGIVRNVFIAATRPQVYYGGFEPGKARPTGLPTKPKGAFLTFYGDQLQTLIGENPPGTKAMILTKRCSEMWKDLPETEKQKYLEQSKETMAVYKEENKKFMATLTREQIEEMQNKKRKLMVERKLRRQYQVAKAQHPAPKRPKSALWLMGSSLVMKENETFPEYVRRVRAQWDQLPYSKKEEFEERHQSQLSEWKVEHGKWVQAMVLDNYGELLSPNEIKHELQRLGKPKRALNTFSLYVRASQMGRGNLSATDYMKELSSRWKQLSDAEKKVFRDEAEIEADMYKKKVSEWEADMDARGDAFAKMAQIALNKLVQKGRLGAEGILAKEKEKMAKEREATKLAKQKEKKKEAKKLTVNQKQKPPRK